MGTHFFAALYELFGDGCVARVRAEVRYPNGDGGEGAEASCTAVLHVRPQLGAARGFEFDPFDLALDLQTESGSASDVYELSVEGDSGALMLFDFTSLRHTGSGCACADVLVQNATYGRAECVQELVRAARKPVGAAPNLVTPRDALQPHRLLHAILPGTAAAA